MKAAFLTWLTRVIFVNYEPRLRKKKSKLSCLLCLLNIPLEISLINNFLKVKLYFSFVKFNNKNKM